jgi:calcineurin-like phosphoesterase family protein
VAVFFTADTHFGHAGARALYRRPFASVAEMDRGMVERWNATVMPADEIWHLGDFALGVRGDALSALLGALSGRKHLILGNNDPPATAELPGWTSVGTYVEMTLEGVGLVLCHYAFRSWNQMGKGWWNLHGHSHGRLKPLPRQADVGVDAWEFRPVSLAEILAKRRSRAGQALG